MLISETGAVQTTYNASLSVVDIIISILQMCELRLRKLPNLLKATQLIDGVTRIQTRLVW